MKKFWILTLWLFTLLFSWNLTQANENYEFTNLDITANIAKDWTIIVKEDYTANFFVERHWITRDIPLNYSVWWKDFHIDISDIHVIWKNFAKDNYNWEWHIKIWDANKTVIWEQNYRISYSTYWLIRNFSWKGYAELYWDLIWNKWNTNFNKFSTEIFLPKPYTWFTANDFIINIGWVKKSIDNFGWTIDRSSWNKIVIKYDKMLPPYTRFTLSVKFPNNYFEFDSSRQISIIWRVWSYEKSYETNNKSLRRSNIIICVSYLLGLALLFIKIPKRDEKKYLQKKWNLKWKFAKKYPVIIQYNPPKWLNSAEVWMLLHRWATHTDLLSLIYKRTQEWLIQISKKDDYIILKKLEDTPEDYPEYEKETFYSIFEDGDTTREFGDGTRIDLDIAIKGLNQHWETQWWLFYKDLSYILKPLYNFWLFLRIIIARPIIFIGTRILFVCVLFIIWDKYPGFVPAFIIISFILIGAISDKFGYLGNILHNLRVIYNRHKKRDVKPDETEEWAKIISKILWYREFLKTCDEKKLKTFLKKDPLYFDKTLPYAIVFGLEAELLEKIKPIMEEMEIEPTQYNWDFIWISDTISEISSVAYSSWSYNWSFSYSSYDSDSWFDSWSSFDSSSSSDSWGWWGWGGWWSDR